MKEMKYRSINLVMVQQNIMSTLLHPGTKSCRIFILSLIFSLLACKTGGVKWHACEQIVNINKRKKKKMSRSSNIPLVSRSRKNAQEKAKLVRDKK